MAVQGGGPGSSAPEARAVTQGCRRGAPESRTRRCRRRRPTPIHHHGLSDHHVIAFDTIPIAEPAFALQSLTPDAPAAALTEVAIEGELDGPMLTLLPRQTYVHHGGGPIEAQHAFPVPHGAALLEVAARIGERRLRAEVRPHRQAEARHEDALDAADLAMALCASRRGS